MLKKLTLTRRRLLALASRTLTFATLSLAFVPRLLLAADSKVKAGGYSDHEYTTLTTLSHDLFPHDSLPMPVYRDVAKTLVKLTVSTPDTYRLIRKGIRDLDRRAGKKTWQVLTYEQRAELLREVETTPFFTTMIGLVEDTLYQHPQVWELLGYGGNALDQGGYLNRGFDDIDWLPESKDG